MRYGSTLAFFTIQKSSKGATNFEKNRYEIVVTLHHIYTSNLSSSLFLGGCRSARSLTFYWSGFTPSENNILQKFYFL